MSKQQMKFFLRSSKYSILPTPEAEFLNLSAGSVVVLLFPASGHVEEGSTWLCGLGQQRAHERGWIHAGCMSAPPRRSCGVCLCTPP